VPAITSTFNWNGKPNAGSSRVFSIMFRIWRMKIQQKNDGNSLDFVQSGNVIVNRVRI
jgi:hypothetical protein